MQSWSIDAKRLGRIPRIVLSWSVLNMTIIIIIAEMIVIIRVTFASLTPPTQKDRGRERNAFFVHCPLYGMTEGTIYLDQIVRT